MRGNSTGLTTTISLELSIGTLWWLLPSEANQDARCRASSADTGFFLRADCCDIRESFFLNTGATLSERRCASWHQRQGRSGPAQSQMRAEEVSACSPSLLIRPGVARGPA